MVTSGGRPSYSGDEARESLEPRRSGLQEIVIAPLHSSLGDRVRPYLEKKKKEKKKKHWL